MLPRRGKRSPKIVYTTFRVSDIPHPTPSEGTNDSSPLNEENARILTSQTRDDESVTRPISVAELVSKVYNSRDFNVSGSSTSPEAIHEYAHSPHIFEKSSITPRRLVSHKSVTSRTRTLPLGMGVAAVGAAMTGACYSHSSMAAQQAQHSVSTHMVISSPRDNSEKVLSQDEQAAVIPSADFSGYLNQLAVGAEFSQEKEQLETANLRPIYTAPAFGTFTSGFGYRWGSLHAGADIAGAYGSPIVAVADGTVVEAGPASGFGQWIRLQHHDGTISVYGHISAIYVHAGQQVLAGDRIAGMGNLGFSTGTHLHLEIWLNGKDKVDPVRWLAARGVRFDGVPYVAGSPISHR